MAAATAAPVREPTAKVTETIGSFRPTKIFRGAKPDTSITSLDFDDGGELIIAACDDESIQLYNCKEGSQVKTLLSKKYGAHLARFTHNSQSVLYASTKGEATIRYLSTHDNQYIRYFKGHTAPVTSLAVSPATDNFLSCSLDGTVKFWSLATPNVTGSLLLQDASLCAYDPSATVLAVASGGTSSVLLYDVRHYDKTPFAVFDLQSDEMELYPNGVGRAAWTKLEFSNDGKSLLIATAGNGHILLDAFDGRMRAFCVRKHGPTGRLAPSQSSDRGVHGSGDACFTPDSRYVIGGSGAENVLVWDTQAAPGPDRKIAPQYEVESKGRVALIEFNPRHNLFVTADKNLVLHVPEKTA
ncbi:MAG: member of Set1p complex, histone methyl transferase [Thelocarpon superellum]|nr:MAG: member of Set1p complex, histone methyl transferase [Thelocarpon superellum]